ncbi:MAG: hypothetical protein Q8O64_11195 [Sideroxyarcus sp.]|nr:hypothetical protein [Sideroxyarcus sp.]
MGNNGATNYTPFRWIAFLPASIAGIIIVPIIVDIANSFAPEWWRGTIMEFIKSAAGGAAFVAFGALTAPKHQFNISIALTVLLGIIGGFLFSKIESSGFNIANIIFGIIGAFGACIYVKWQKI